MAVVSRFNGVNFYTNQMKQQILNTLQAKHDSTGGHCGTYIHKLGVSVTSEVKSVLKALIRDNKITYHDGVHGVMFKIKL